MVSIVLSCNGEKALNREIQQKIFVQFFYLKMDQDSSYTLHIGEESKWNSSIASDSARVLVLGDGSVGKTALIHLLCHKKVLTNPTTTIGCSLEMKVKIL